MIVQENPHAIPESRIKTRARVIETFAGRLFGRIPLADTAIQIKIPKIRDSRSV